MDSNATKMLKIDRQGPCGGSAFLKKYYSIVAIPHQNYNDAAK